MAKAKVYSMTKKERVAFYTEQIKNDLNDGKITMSDLANKLIQLDIVNACISDRMDVIKSIMSPAILDGTFIAPFKVSVDEFSANLDNEDVQKAYDKDYVIAHWDELKVFEKTATLARLYDDFIATEQKDKFKDAALDIYPMTEGMTEKQKKELIGQRTAYTNRQCNEYLLKKGLAVKTDKVKYYLKG